eukprot:5805418-Lingulodinium_polyedra.AAC.1
MRCWSQAQSGVDEVAARLGLLCGRSGARWRRAGDHLPVEPASLAERAGGHGRQRARGAADARGGRG